MSVKIKAIIPLLFSSTAISQKDFSYSAGFVDAYNYDINRPAIFDCIFLMYDNSIKTIDSQERYFKFLKLKNLRSLKVYMINGKSYTIYAIQTVDHLVKRMIKSVYPMIYKPEIILKFWGTSDINFTKYVLNPSENKYNFEVESVPEIDFQYTISDSHRLQKKEIIVPKKSELQSPLFFIIFASR